VVDGPTIGKNRLGMWENELDVLGAVEVTVGERIKLY
jgi:hypothetical protein